MLDINFIKNCLSIVEKSIEAPINGYRDYRESDGYDKYLIIYRVKGELKSEVVYGGSVSSAVNAFNIEDGEPHDNIVSIRLLGDPYNALDLAQNFELTVNDSAILTFSKSLVLRYYEDKPYGTYLYKNYFGRQGAKKIYFLFPNFAEKNYFGVTYCLPTINEKPKQIKNRRLKMSLKLLGEDKDEKTQFFEVTNFSFLNGKLKI